MRAVYAAQGQSGSANAAARPREGPPAAHDSNVLMNDDSYPPVPQNETAVAYKTREPKVAVAASNDYVSGGVVVMRTSDGGKHWASTRITPRFGGTGDFCNGGDPGVAYSRRDRAFYLSQLCFFRALPFSEVQVYKSVDDGQTWTPGRFASRAATNFDYAHGTVDDSIFNDKELITVDNNPSSPHYGRVYVTYTKFHLQPSGFSDYCPIQLSYTDSIPTANPLQATWAHTAVQPDDPGGDGTGASANQFSQPVVEKDGTLDVGFVSENCNDSLDPHLLFQSRPTAGRRSSRARCRSTSPGSTRTSTTAPVPTPSRPRTSARRTPPRWPTARGPATCCTSTRTTSTGRSRRPTSPTRPRATVG